MLRIVTDTAADLPIAWIRDYAVELIPINIHFGEKTYLQGIDLTDQEFYRIANETGRIPKTSQPSPGQFVDFYRRVAQPGDTVISVHVTAKLSGTFDSAVMAARELAGEMNVIPFDSACGSAGQGYLCKEARLLDLAGAPIETILARMEAVRRGMEVILTLNTMEYARMSGRVKAMQAALASLLNVKPIIALHEGVLDVADKVRTRKKALETILDMAAQRLGDQPVNAAVVHALDEEAGQELMEKVAGRLNCNELVLTGLSVAVAANLGPGTVGIVAYPVVEQLER